MGSHDDRLEGARSQIRQAREALSGISDEHRDLAPEELDRFAEVLHYAEQILAHTRPTLVPDDAWGSINNRLQQFADQLQSNPAALVQDNLTTFSSEVMRALAQFPPGEGRISEQQVAQGMDEVRAAAATRVEAITVEAREVTEQIGSLKAEIESKDTELKNAIAQRTEELQTSLSNLESELGDEKQRIEATTTEQAETFRQAQEERDGQFKAAIEELRSGAAEREKDARDRVDALVRDIEAMQEESANLVGSIGVTGTAERYRDEASDQKTAADQWRWIAVVAAAFAVVVALFAAVTVGSDSGDILPFVGKLAIGVVLGGLATYAAKQSGRHRDREETAKSVQLDLAAFNAFVEPLPPDLKAAERVKLGRRIFGQHFAMRELRGKEIGPNAARLIADSLRDRGISEDEA